MSKVIKKIGKATRNFLIKKKWKIIFVVIIPVIGNCFLVAYLERGICRFELPVAVHQDDLIACNEALNGADPLSRINPDLANLLRYNLFIKNKLHPVDSSENTNTSTLNFLIENDGTDEPKRLPTGDSDEIEKNLSRSEVIDRLKNYTPICEVTKGIYAGSWELGYKPDFPSTIIQFIITLVAWFQLVEIYLFLKK